MSEQRGQAVAATAYETRMHYLANQKRTATPVRRDFVQWPRGSETRPSVLAEFVRNGDRRGLLAYLFVIAMTSAEHKDGWTTTLNSRVWARCFGTTESTSSNAAALSAVHRILKRLEKRNLIAVHQGGRSANVSVTLLREDGTRKNYTHPGSVNDPYIQIPHAFWEKELDKLEMPALAMLLVAMCEKADLTLPYERVPQWYGWSADTAARGFTALGEAGLIGWRDDYRKDPASPQGYTLARRYRLRAPFSHPHMRTGAGDTNETGEEVSKDGEATAQKA